MWLQTNYLPEIHGRDAGIWRRLKVIPWLAIFEGTADDTDLDQKLRQEAAGIFNWLVAGCLDWQRHRLDDPPQVIAETARYRATEALRSRLRTGGAVTKGVYWTSRRQRGVLLIRQLGRKAACR
jgi:hypothetical protein